MATNALQERFGTRFRRIITNTEDGVPPWMDAVESGETRGLYLPHDAPWVVHGDVATLVGGIRALLMQALHPGSLAGVEQHSRYEQDALGRLSGTIRWLTVTTFGSYAAVAGEASRVNRLHERVSGKFTLSDGSQRLKWCPSLLMWCHPSLLSLAFLVHIAILFHGLCRANMD